MGAYRQVEMYNLDGELVAEWKSISRAARMMGLSGPSISACCGGKTRTCGGYVWRYKDDARPVAWEEKVYAVYMAGAEVLGSWHNASECARHFGIDRSTVSKVMAGAMPSWKGVMFLRSGSEALAVAETLSKGAERSAELVRKMQEK